VNFPPLESGAVTPVLTHGGKRADPYQIDHSFASTLRKRTTEREQDPNSSLLRQERILDKVGDGMRQDKYQVQDPLDQILDGKLRTPQHKIKSLQA
jgi:hypothetical protein